MQQTADLLESAENLAGVFKIKGDSSSVLLAHMAESFIEVLGFSNQEEVEVDIQAMHTSIPSTRSQV